MLTTALAILPENTFAAIDYLAQQSDQKEVIKTYSQLVTKLYWEKKDLSGVITLAIAGIQYATYAARSSQTTNPELATEFLGSAKAIAYNLASFAWSGWDEVGIIIGPTEAQIGLEAAKTNLRLAKELSRGDLPLCRAYWMLGAHCLSSGLKDKAKEYFSESAEYANRAQEKSEELLAIGYCAVTTLSETPNAEEALRKLAEVKTQLEKLENGPDFVQKLDTAVRLFAPSALIE